MIKLKTWKINSIILNFNSKKVNGIKKYFKCLPTESDTIKLSMIRESLIWKNNCHTWENSLKFLSNKELVFIKKQTELLKFIRNLWSNFNLNKPKDKPISKILTTCSIKKLWSINQMKCVKIKSNKLLSKPCKTKIKMRKIGQIFCM
jgi:hypothetical protein